MPLASLCHLNHNRWWISVVHDASYNKSFAVVYFGIIFQANIYLEILNYWNNAKDFVFYWYLTSMISRFVFQVHNDGNFIITYYMLSFHIPGYPLVSDNFQVVLKRKVPCNGLMCCLIVIKINSYQKLPNNEKVFTEQEHRCLVLISILSFVIQ